MYEVKSKIFLEFVKSQKSALCNHLRALVKQNLHEEKNIILQKFLDNEKYYLEINFPHFEFLKDFLDSKEFVSETELYIEECIKYYTYKEQQKPLIQAQKAFEKKKRKFLQGVKMSKELPTKKQVFYYNSLCERYNIDKKDINELSRLDLRNLIDEILNEYKTN